jgi:hypothetical protein
VIWQSGSGQPKAADLLAMAERQKITAVQLQEAHVSNKDAHERLSTLTYKLSSINDEGKAKKAELERAENEQDIKRLNAELDVLRSLFKEKKEERNHLVASMPMPVKFQALTGQSEKLMELEVEDLMQELGTFYGSGSSLLDQGVGQMLASTIVRSFPTLTLEDVAVVVADAKAGKLGKVFGKLESPQVMQWLRDYQERLRLYIAEVQQERHERRRLADLGNLGDRKQMATTVDTIGPLNEQDFRQVKSNQ